MIINSLDLILLSIPVALMGYLITRFIIMRIVSRIFRKTATKLDDILIEKGLFNKLSYLVPIAIIYNFIQASGLDSILFSRLIFSLFTVVIMSSMNSLLSAINQILSDSKISNRVNVKSYIQIIRLILNLFSILLIIAILTGKSPIYLLSGLGALTAVLMLVFKDTILS